VQRKGARTSCAVRETGFDRTATWTTDFVATRHSQQPAMARIAIEEFPFEALSQSSCLFVPGRSTLCLFGPGKCKPEFPVLVREHILILHETIEYSLRHNYGAFSPLCIGARCLAAVSFSENERGTYVALDVATLYGPQLFQYIG
jgi:hypothetical protein